MINKKIGFFEVGLNKNQIFIERAMGEKGYLGRETLAVTTPRSVEINQDMIEG
jgi:hypothetical protein